MALPDTIRTILGIIGNVTSLFLFLSPVSTFYKVWKWKSTRQFSGVPYVATLANCLLWVLYGIPVVHPHSILVITINGTGVVLEFFYLSMFILYSPKNDKLKVVKALGAVLILFAGVAVLTLTVFHSHEKRSLFVGLLAVVFCTGMYAAPLSVMKLVIKTKSVKYMPLSLSLAGLANGIVWTAYALIRFDIFVTIPNGIGSLLGIAQLILYGLYYKTTNWDEEEDDEDDDKVKSVKAEMGNINKQRVFGEGENYFNGHPV
ncbi:hypothetical protein SUGI_0769520 [Cryptomeria japonica]|uniref:bidirectional sugar transporter SWEET4 n=1 Tax=Cryptomeria japonica TaxID=3369 RepID=UPI002414B2E1|nr:bidirectional sugar transporter SWEET4 [Cryptomeria japonica]GLJ37831.1 hypothetical protein SUGI_0769520 [Cryptomeria japonica]